MTGRHSAGHTSAVRMAALVGVVLLAPALVGAQVNTSRGARTPDWGKVCTLEPGTEITLTVKDSPPAKVRVLFADETTVVTLRATAPSLPRRVKQVLFELGPKWSGIVNDGQRHTVYQVRVSQEGISMPIGRWPTSRRSCGARPARRHQRDSRSRAAERFDRECRAWRRRRCAGLTARRLGAWVQAVRQQL